jgi:hypothetical protein
MLEKLNHVIQNSGKEVHSYGDTVCTLLSHKIGVDTFIANWAFPLRIKLQSHLWRIGGFLILVRPNSSVDKMQTRRTEYTATIEKI